MSPDVLRLLDSLRMLHIVSHCLRRIISSTNVVWSIIKALETSDTESVVGASHFFKVWDGQRATEIRGGVED